MSKPPFISIPRVYQKFDFRVLRQNRRVVSDERRRDELENFHQAGGARNRALGLPARCSQNAIARCCSTSLTASRPKGCETSSCKPTCAERNAAVRIEAASKTPRRCLQNEGAANPHMVGIPIDQRFPRNLSQSARASSALECLLPVLLKKIRLRF